MSDEQWMRQALALAQESAEEGEVPVGCVIVQDDRVVGSGRNRRELGKNALFHAETQAIDAACRTLGGWRLWQCCLYVTLEPCPMCAGAILNARLPRVVFGTRDTRFGAAGSAVNLLAMPEFYQPEVVEGVLAEESRALLQAFFRALRSKEKPRWEYPAEQ
jgi:tRNA(adenine34) deaminase